MTDEKCGTGGTGATGRVLRDRDAALYLGGVVGAGCGASLLWLTAGIWVKDLTGSNALAALCTFALWAPVLLGPLLGTLADRTRRHPLLVRSNLALALLLLTLCAVDSADRLWLLFTVLVLYGATGVVQDAAEGALVTRIVDRDLLGDFNGLRTTANEGVKLIAPLAGAGLFTAYGGPAVAVLAAVLFALAAGLYARVRVDEPRPEAGTARGFGAVAEGVRELWDRPALRPLLVGGGAVMLLAGVNGAVVFAVVDEGLGRPPGWVGALYTAQGVGSVAVGAVAGRLLRRLGERRFAAYGAGLFAVAVAARAVPDVSVALVASAAVGAGLPCVLIAALTAVQRAVPEAFLGRAVATANTLLLAPNAVALGVGAGLVAGVDHRVLLLALGSAGLVVAGRLRLRL
ncbi:MFS transporter [Streptomyces uncialis]|uniref:MFS transporter n=1 Tax=Streptomyces uncialis TaxID=1048205 RepID=UPI003867CEC3|nr:MFS transporter [Streptomyces uncialis]